MFRNVKLMTQFLLHNSIQSMYQFQKVNNIAFLHVRVVKTAVI